MLVTGTSGQGFSLAQMQGQRQGMRPPPTAENMTQHALDGMDSDDDGSISSSESKFSDEIFAEIDTDGNGIADSEELNTHHEARAAEMQSMADSGDFEGLRAMMGEMPPPPQGMEGMGGKGQMMGGKNRQGTSLTQVAANNAYAESSQYSYSMDSALMEQLDLSI